MGRLFITGDKHGIFQLVEKFVEDYHTTKDDYLIVLGDAGVNYYNDERDQYLKNQLEALPITFLFIHGNHEMRPQTISTYELRYLETSELTGAFYIEPEYPSLLFVRRGLFWFQNKRFLVCDGAYSVDKFYRLTMGWNWWPDEQMTDDDKVFIRKVIEFNPQCDYVLSHAAPLSQEPRHLFMTSNQFRVDRSTPEFLDEIYDSIDHDYLIQWYFGHYHGDEKLPDKFTILFNSFEQVV